MAHVVEAGLLVGRDEGGHARLGGVAHGAAELLEGDVLAGDRLHHVGAGDEHVRGALHHEDEVGHGRRVDRAAGAGPQDHADLGDHARGRDVAVEDPAVGVQRDDALLDPRPGTVVEPDHRNPGGGGQVHDLVDLLGEDLAEGAAEDGEVLAEEADPPAVDGAEARHHAVGVGPVVLEPHAVGPVPGQHVELLEGPLVEQVLDPLPGGQLPLGVVALDRSRAAGVEGLVLAFGQVGQAFGHGVFHAAEANAPGEDPEIGERQSGPPDRVRRHRAATPALPGGPCRRQASGDGTAAARPPDRGLPAGARSAMSKAPSDRGAAFRTGRQPRPVGSEPRPVN